MFVKDKKSYSLDTKAIGIPYADKGNIGRYGETDMRDAGNVWHICYEKTTGKTIKKGHEAPFSIGLPYRCLKCVPNTKTVLDPFLGTGTTLAAALKLGIAGFGYEKYSRKELIKRIIMEGINYVERQTVLLPHYEVSIIKLLKILEKSKINDINFSSKKGKQRIEILIDTLKKMGVKEKYNKLIHGILK